MVKNGRWRDVNMVTGIITLTLLLFSSLLLTAQNTVEKVIYSELLQENRKLFIQLPNNYNDDKKYPVIIVLDGGYMFSPVTGNVDFYTQLDRMPASIVVGVDQNYIDKEGISAHWVDCRYDDNTGLLIEKGLLFYEFINDELIDFLESNYSIVDFITIIGVSFTANYINYFMFAEDSKIRGFVALSPFYAPNSKQRFNDKIKNMDEHFFYYLCTGDNDLDLHITSINKMNDYLSNTYSEFFHYDFDNFDNFDNADHSTIVAHGLPRALELIYQKYDGLREGELDQLSSDINPLDYIELHYDLIEDICGVRRSIREFDLRLASYVLDAGRKWVN